MKLSIILPCYNEELSILKLVDRCLCIISDQLEIIFVDNGSTDNTFKILKTLTLPSNIKVIRVKENIGYGHGILYGLKHAKGEIISWTHADLQTDISDVLTGYNCHKMELIKKRCLVKGERKNRNLFDSFFTFCMGVYSSIVLKKWLFDINAQPKLFHRSFLKEFVNPPLDFSLDLYLIHYFKTKNISVETFPVFFNKREFGEAKGGGTFKGKVRLIKRTFRYINLLKTHI